MDQDWHETIDHDEPLIHDWRARQLARLGIPRALAEAVADHVDWHQIAALVCRGCPPRLALQIVLLGLAGAADLRADWNRRYGTPVTSWRPQASQAKQDELAIAYARDGYALLEAVHGKPVPGWLLELPAVDVLRRVLLQNCARAITTGAREVIKRREKEPEGDGLPPAIPGSPLL